MARIGGPIDRPWAGVQVILPEPLALSDVERTIRDVVESEVARLPAFREELVVANIRSLNARQSPQGPRVLWGRAKPQVKKG